MAEMCKIHPDVPYIVREGTSVHGGHIGWGCAVCNMLKLDEARKRIRELEAQIAKLVQARELAAAASATLREESIAKNQRIVELEARNRFLEEMGAECAQDWQKIERLVLRDALLEAALLTRLEKVTVERDQARAAYDRMTAAAGDAQKRIGELEAVTAQDGKVSLMDSPDVIGADLAPMPPARCSRRGCVNEARALHPCPYASEINDDSESLCDCCEKHTQECADDI